MGDDEGAEVKSSEFDFWLKETIKDFKNLSLDRKVITLQGLLEATPKNQQYILMDLVGKYIPNNFFVCLPTELHEYICNFLDVESLLIACQVCNEWNVIISSLQGVWYKKYIYMSVGSASQCNVNWKNKCLEALQFCKGINNGSLFRQDDICALCLSEGQITVLEYFGGLLVGGANSLVGVWNMKNCKLMTTFQVPSRISCIHLTEPFIIVGHSTGCITVWKFIVLEDFVINVTLYRELHSHTGVIMCLSTCSVINILASGATDSSVKLWSLSSGVLLRTLVNYTDWVIEITVLPPSTFNNKMYSENHSLVSMTKDFVRVSLLEIVSKDALDIKVVEAAHLEYPLHSQLNCFTPGIHVVGDNLIYIDCWAPPLYEEEKWFNIVFRNMMPENNFKRLLAPYTLRKLLAVGEKLALLMLHSDAYTKINLLILELESGREIGGCLVPHSSSSSPAVSQVTVGEVQWLNDFSLLKPNSLIVALGLPHGQIRTVSWKEFKINEG